jgi:serine/threonine protein kinase
MKEKTFLGILKQKSPIVDIFNEQVQLTQFAGNCSIAVKISRLNTSADAFEQTLNEIRICAKIGYHRNVCTMLGYVSNERIVCLLLELADGSLLDALIAMHKQLLTQTRDVNEIGEYLKNTALQIASGMVILYCYSLK